MPSLKKKAIIMAHIEVDRPLCLKSTKSVNYMVDFENPYLSYSKKAKYKNICTSLERTVVVFNFEKRT